jgi:hypothetical protein
MVTGDPEVRAIAKWADIAMADVLLADGQRAYVIVPHGPRDRDAFSRAEAELIARGMELDWRHHPDELVRRTVQDTLRLFAHWDSPREVLEGAAFGVFGWNRAEGMRCPVCDEDSCLISCPMRRVGVRPAFAAPSITYLSGNLTVRADVREHRV